MLLAQVVLVDLQTMAQTIALAMVEKVVAVVQVATGKQYSNKNKEKLCLSVVN